MQDDLRAARLDRGDLDVRRGHRHHDRRRAAEPLRRERDALRVVAGGRRDHAARAFGRGQVRHLVVGAAQLEREHRLLVLALEQHAVAQAMRQRHREVERGLDRDVVDLRVEDLAEIVDRHGGGKGSDRSRFGGSICYACARHGPPPPAPRPVDARRGRHGIEQLPPRDRPRRRRPDLPARHRARDPAAGRRDRRARQPHARRAEGGGRLPRALRRAHRGLRPLLRARGRDQHVPRRAQRGDVPAARGGHARLPDRRHRRARGSAPDLPRRRARAAAHAGAAARRRHRRRVDRVHHRARDDAGPPRVAEDGLRHDERALLRRRVAARMGVPRGRDARPRGDRGDRARVRAPALDRGLRVLRHRARAGRHPRAERALAGRHHARGPAPAAQADDRGRPRAQPQARGPEGRARAGARRRLLRDGGGGRRAAYRAHQPGRGRAAPGRPLRPPRPARAARQPRGDDRGLLRPLPRRPRARGTRRRAGAHALPAGLGAAHRRRGRAPPRLGRADARGRLHGLAHRLPQARRLHPRQRRHARLLAPGPAAPGAAGARLPRRPREGRAVARRSVGAREDRSR